MIPKATKESFAKVRATLAKVDYPGKPKDQKDQTVEDQMEAVKRRCDRAMQNVNYKPRRKK